MKLKSLGSTSKALFERLESLHLRCVKDFKDKLFQNKEKNAELQKELRYKDIYKMSI